MNLLLENKFQFNHPLDLERESRIVYNPSLDWSLNPFGDPEWTFVLNRMEYLYQLDDDPKSIAKLQELVINWIETVSLDDHFVRTIDTAFRITVWADVFDKFTTSQQQLVIASIQQQIDYIETNYSDRHLLLNWGLIQSCSLVYVANKLSGLKVNKVHKKRIKLMLEHQFTTSGMHVESSTLYLFEVIRQLDKVCEIEGYEFIRPVLLRAKSTLANLRLNSGYLACIGDSDFHLAIDIFQVFNMSDIKPANNIPDGICHIQKGQFEVILVNAKHGGGHGHFMNNHIEVCVGTTSLFTDCGRYNYQDISERNFLKSYEAHNTVNNFQSNIQVLNSWKNDGTKQTFPIECYTTGDDQIIISTWRTQDFIHNRLVWLTSDFVVIVDNCNKDYELTFNCDLGVEYEGQMLYTDDVQVHVTCSKQLVGGQAIQSRVYNEYNQINKINVKSCSGFTTTALSLEASSMIISPIYNCKDNVVDNYQAITVGSKTLILSFEENLAASIPYYYQGHCFNCRLGLISNDQMSVIKS